MNHINRPYVLSIAGFDPSAGAGVLSDVKTFEAHGVYGLGVVSALTWQNDISFERVEWLPLEKITEQVAVLLKRFDIKYVKIGLVECMDVLERLIDYLKTNIADVVIVFDPILKASAGFVFHEGAEQEFIDAIDGVHCITPNIPEAEQLFGEEGLQDKLEALSERVNIYLKGGHSDKHSVVDLLYTADHTYAFSNDRLAHGAKHGSGCVLSAALTAALALGNELPDAAEQANTYTYNFLASSDTLLGHHQSTAI